MNRKGLGALLYKTDTRREWLENPNIENKSHFRAYPVLR